MKRGKLVAEVMQEAREADRARLVAEVIRAAREVSNAMLSAPTHNQMTLGISSRLFDALVQLNLAVTALEKTEGR